MARIGTSSIFIGSSDTVWTVAAALSLVVTLSERSESNGQRICFCFASALAFDLAVAPCQEQKAKSQELTAKLPTPL